MLNKNGVNAWTSTKKSAGGDQRHEVGSWPRLRKQETFKKSNEVEGWPKLGGAHGRKVDAGNQVDKLQLVHQMGSSSGNNISPAGLPKSLIIPKDKQEFLSKSQSNECKTFPVNTAHLSTGSPADLIQASQKLPDGNSEKVTLSNKEEKSLVFKQLKKERKEELRVAKQRKKEDATLWKMVGPKGLKVTVIDDNIFSKFCDQSGSRNRSQKSFFNTSEEQLNSSAFPELRRSSGKLGVKYNTPRPKRTLNSIPVGDNEGTKFNTEENAEGLLDANSTRSTKIRKRRDPVVVDIWKALEICKAEKKLEGDEEEKVSRPKEEKRRLPGNILDASNPLRHRGKKRETPRKRDATRLKKAILAERRRRLEARNGGSKSASVGNIEAREAKILNSDEALVLVPGINEMCNPIEVVQESLMLGNSNEMKDEEKKGQIEKCLLKQCSDASNAVDVDKMTKESLHSRSFREYCNHSKSSDLSENVKLMLKDILKFQDRMHATQPIKAESHRRYVVGLRQTQHLLAAHKVKIVIMAQDLEKVPSPGGLDDLVNSIIDSAIKKNIPIVFPLTRRQMGRVTYRKVGVSCVGVLNYQGSEENFKKVISALEESKRDYEEKFEKEKFRIMSELGILPIKKENCESAGTEEQVQPSPVKCAATLPLFRKLTEAISELSVGSASQLVVKEELCDL